jgi:Immunity protein Imm1
MAYSAEAYYTHAHTDDPVIISTPEGMDRVIDDLLAGDWEHSVAAVYLRERPLNAAGVPDHELLVAVDADTGLGALFLNAPGETHSLYSKGTTQQPDDVLYYYMGSERDFPHDSEIPVDAVRHAAKEFLATGKRPTCVQWQPNGIPTQA